VEDVLLVAHMLMNGNTNFCEDTELQQIDLGHAKLTLV
jgi:hypothetical protein